MFLVVQVSQTYLRCTTSPRRRRLACSSPLDLRSRMWRRCSAHRRPGRTAPVGSRWTPSWSPPRLGSLPLLQPSQSNWTTLTGPQTLEPGLNPPCGWGGRQRVSSVSGKFSGLFSWDRMNTKHCYWLCAFFSMVVVVAVWCSEWALTSAGRYWSERVWCLRRRRRTSGCPRSRTAGTPHSRAPWPEGASCTGRRRSYWTSLAGCLKPHPDTETSVRASRCLRE